MDHRKELAIKKEWIDPVYAMIQSGGDTAALIDAIQARIDLIARASQNKAYTLAGLTIGSVSALKIKAANSITYVNDGLLYTTTTFEVVFGATAATTVPISSFCKYLVTLKAGTPKVTEGNIAASAILALLPAVPAGETPIGYLQVATSGAGTFVPDTDSLADAAVTDTYVDLAWPNSGVDALITGLGALTHPTDVLPENLG